MLPQCVNSVLAVLKRAGPKASRFSIKVTLESMIADVLGKYAPASVARTDEEDF
jgi:hypothetical protein